VKANGRAPRETSAPDDTGRAQEGRKGGRTRGFGDGTEEAIDLGGYEDLSRWLDELEARPAFKRALAMTAPAAQ
jgi:glutathione S-transferase